LKIISVQFDYSGTNRYKILSQVFGYSVKKNCPNAELEMIRVRAPGHERKVRSKSFSSNTLKLDLWLNALNKTDDNVVFMDCDMIVLKDISPAFNLDFDIGYTKRTGSHIPYNGGVVFVRNTPAAKEFIQLWKKINKKMYEDYEFHRPWRDKYGGMNQAAFGYIMEKEKNFKAKLKEFRCDVWNSCDDNWKKLDDTTRVIHIKGGLRRSVLMQKPIPTQYDRAIIVWRNLAIEAGVMVGRKTVDNILVIKPHPLMSKVRGIVRRRKIF